MCLSEIQIATIKAATAKHFGQDARIWLFGFRSDDDRRGSDYDFYIETAWSDAAQVIENKTHPLVDLHKAPCSCDETINIVVKPALDLIIELPIYQVAKREGLEL